MHCSQPRLPTEWPLFRRLLLRIKGVCILRDQQMLQSTITDLRTGGCHEWRQICCGDSNACPCIGDVMFQLFGAVHRIDRHHHCVGAQYAKVSNHPLRAVLHVEQHPVALLDSHAGQPSGNTFGLISQLKVTRAAAQKYQCIFVRKTTRTDIEVVPHSGVCRRQTVWHALRPMGVVRFHVRRG